MSETGRAPNNFRKVVPAMRAEDRGSFRGSTLLAEALAETYGDGRLGISEETQPGCACPHSPETLK